jgi:hypothetical protein
VREAAKKDKKLKFTALLHHAGIATAHLSEELPREWMASRGKNMEKIWRSD